MRFARAVLKAMAAAIAFLIFGNSGHSLDVPEGERVVGYNPEMAALDGLLAPAACVDGGCPGPLRSGAAIGRLPS